MSKTEALSTTTEEEIEEEDPIYRRAEWTMDGTPLAKIRFQKDETGWAYDMGDGKYRLANTPIIGMCTGYGDAVLPRWGDLVSIHGGSDELKYLTIHEKFVPEDYLVPREQYLAYYKELQNEVLSVREQLGSDSTSDKQKEKLRKREEAYLDAMDSVWERLPDSERSGLTHHRP